MIGDRCYYADKDPGRNAGFQQAKALADKWDVINSSDSWNLTDAERAKLGLSKGAVRKDDKGNDKDYHLLGKEDDISKKDLDMISMMGGNPNDWPVVQTSEMKDQGLIALNINGKKLIISEDTTPDLYNEMDKRMHNTMGV